MTDLLAGSKIKALDTPPTVQVTDTTTMGNISNTTYSAGTPEVGVTFTAPTSGRVNITISGGLRNNAANSDRAFLTAQVFLGVNSAGTEVLVPSVTVYGVSTPGGSATMDYIYSSRTAMLDGLTAGATYYVRTMHLCSVSVGGPGNTCDLNYRGILVTPVS